MLYFASFRDAVGREEEFREIEDRARVDDLWTILAREVPLFARFPSMPPAARNREYVAPGTPLRDGDEIAFLPPVAGG